MTSRITFLREVLIKSCTVIREMAVAEMDREVEAVGGVEAVVGVEAED